MNHRLSTFCLPAAAIAASLLAAPTCAQAQQTLYVSTASGTVDTISPDGTVSTYLTLSSGGKGGNLDGMAFDAQGDLYVANEKTN